MQPTHLDLLTAVTSPAVHPDGWAVVALSRPDLAADAYVGQLWKVPLDGTPARRITRGFLDSEPRLSPDGALIGFLRTSPGGRAQVAVVPSAGGEPLLVTDAPLGVSEFEFTPDSARIVLLAAVPEPGRYGTTPGVERAAEDPRRLTGLQFRLNGRGWTIDQRVQVFVVDVPDPFGEPPVAPAGRAAAAEPPSLLPAATQLTKGDHDHHGLAVGEGFVVVSAAVHEGREQDLRHDLVRISLADGSTEPLTGPLPDGSVLYADSPVLAGDQVWFRAGNLGPDGLGFVGTNTGVHRVGVGGGDIVTVSDPDELDVIALAPDGAGGVLAIAEVRGAGVALRFGPDGERTTVDAPPGGSVLAVAGAGGVVVAAVSLPDSPGEVARLGEDAAVLTEFAGPLRAAADPVRPVELLATAPDGHPVHGWVLVPPGEGPHPVLLCIHGGPFAAYGPGFFDEAQVYAGAGYAVVMCNPRGSSSYGQEHGRAIQGAMGDRDAVDVLAFLDHALDTVAGLDSSRVGVMGGSYGGYLTAWLIAHEHRFAGAIVERAYLDPKAFIGASDIGWYFPAGYHGDRAAMDAQAPLLLADQVRTPTLVLHSEDDLRCPLTAALRYYTELKLAGVDTELLVFPGENHELSRSGRPVHRRQRFEAILDWWGKHLPV